MSPWPIRRLREEPLAGRPLVTLRVPYWSRATGWAWRIVRLWREPR